ncbi:MAG: hypothetical protein EFT35_03980 [Methanophagales archaeon ANME-1-THS]|nr:MAG: hypothetical protein EFT35_03980 [Methanophagales archaeon ANME-1-THS]
MLDTDIASAFAKAGHFNILKELFGGVGITAGVYEELLTSLRHGYEYPKEIFTTADLVTLSEEEQKEYLKFVVKYVKIGRGELESIIVCLKRGYLFSSFDKRAISTATELGVNIITAGAILKGLIVKGVATEEGVLRIIRDIEISDNRVLEVDL